MAAPKKDRTWPLCTLCHVQHGPTVEHECVACDTCDRPLYHGLGLSGRLPDRHKECRQLHEAFEAFRKTLGCVPDLTFPAMKELRGKTWHLLNTSLNGKEHQARQQTGRLIHLRAPGRPDRPTLSRCGHDGVWMLFDELTRVTCPRCSERGWSDLQTSLEKRVSILENNTTGARL